MEQVLENEYILVGCGIEWGGRGKVGGREAIS